MKNDTTHVTEEQQNNKGKAKEINIVALMSVREMLGWSKKTLIFTDKNLSDLLKQIIAKDGKSLYDILIQEDGAVRPEYMVWLNNRPIKQEHSLDIPLESEDRIVVMPVIRFAAGG
jgi:sulfur carrier protein ThiS